MSVGVTMDSVKLSFPTTAIVERLDRAFRRSVEQDGDGAIRRETLALEAPNRAFGLKSFAIRPNETVIEMSAKILREDYPRLLSRDTFETALLAINKSYGVRINPDVVIESGRFLRVDVTTDMYLPGDPSRYISALGLFDVGGVFRAESYRQESIVFTNRAKSFRERATFYDKYRQVNKASERDLRTYIDPKLFRGVLRMEQGVSSFKKLREKFRVGEPTIESILESTANPNFALFRKIESPTPPTLLDFEPGRTKFNEIVKRRGYETLLREVGLDMSRFRKLCMQYVKGDPTYYLRIAKTVRAEMLGRESRPTNESRDFRIREIEEALRVA